MSLESFLGVHAFADLEGLAAEEQEEDYDDGGDDEDSDVGSEGPCFVGLGEVSSGGEFSFDLDALVFDASTDFFRGHWNSRFTRFDGGCATLDIKGFVEDALALLHGGASTAEG